VFGFLASKEVKEAGLGNLGLHDREQTANKAHDNSLLNNHLEREAMRWVQRYIGQFGGDPKKVTM
jgi:carboxylesterase type B